MVVIGRGRLLVGSALLGVGAVLLAGQAGLLDAGEVLATWWPVLVIAAGMLKLTERPRDLGGALAVTGAGLVLLAWRLDLVGAVLLPIVFIAAGIVVLFRAPHAERSQLVDGDVQVAAVFGSRDARAGAAPFSGGRAVAVFGGVDLDLRDATLPADGATLEVVSVFSDVEVLLPLGWAVEVDGPVVLGDLDDRTLGAREGAPVLKVRATVVLGDLELRTDATARARPTPAT